MTTTVSIKDAITDITKNVISTGFFDKIKITAGKKNTTIESLEKDKQVILKASTLHPVDGWEGEFGLSNIGLLSSIVNNSEFTHKDSKLTLVTVEKDGVNVPTELQYVNKSKSFISYRFVAKTVVPEQPKYTEPTWDVKIKPTKNAIQQFAWAAASLGAYEQYFIPKTVDGELKFFIGEETAASQRGGTVFATNVIGNFDSSHKWPIAMIGSILKLVDGTDAEMSLSVKGAIQLKLNTGISEYKFIFPAKLR
jgi:hypothetical protein